VSEPHVAIIIVVVLILGMLLVSRLRQR